MDDSSKNILFLEVFIIIPLLVIFIVQALVTHQPIFIYDFLLNNNTFIAGREYLGYCNILLFISSCLILDIMQNIYYFLSLENKSFIFIFIFTSFVLLVASLIMFCYSYNFNTYRLLGVGTTSIEIGGELLLLKEVTNSIIKNNPDNYFKNLKIASILFIYIGLFLVILSTIF